MSRKICVPMVDREISLRVEEWMQNRRITTRNSRKDGEGVGDLCGLALRGSEADRSLEVVVVDL